VVLALQQAFLKSVLGLEFVHDAIDIDSGVCKREDAVVVLRRVPLALDAAAGTSAGIC